VRDHIVQLASDPGTFLDHGLAPGDEVSGLAVIEMKDTTIVVGSGQHATVDEIGNVVIRLGEEVL